MRSLDKTKSYYLGDLSDEQLQKVIKQCDKDMCSSGLSNLNKEDLKKGWDVIFFKNNQEWWIGKKIYIDVEPTSALELFYTLENVQVDCRELSSENIEQIANVFHKNKIPTDFNDLNIVGGSCYIHKGDNLCFVRYSDEEKHTITYDKFMELFGCSNENKSELFCEKMVKVVNSDNSQTFNPQKHYDNTNGSLYKICEDLGLNTYEFDIIKRIVRSRKKGQFKEDLLKTKDLIDLYLIEQEENNK